MELTEDVNLSTRARLKRDPELCREVLKEALEVLLGGEPDVSKALLRNYVIARTGFDELARLIGKRPESLMRMLSRAGNPQANNLVEIIRALLELEGVRAEVRLKKLPAKVTSKAAAA